MTFGRLCNSIKGRRVNSRDGFSTARTQRTMVEYREWVQVAFGKCGGPSTDGGIDLETIAALWQANKETLKAASREEARALLECP